MISDIEERAIRLAEYIIETGGTVRSAAAHFGISKSTVHMDNTNRNGFGGWSDDQDRQRRGNESFPPALLHTILRWAKCAWTSLPAGLTQTQIRIALLSVKEPESSKIPKSDEI